MRRTTFLALSFLLFNAAALNAAPDKRELPLNKYTDIFLITKSADITLSRSTNAAHAIYWQDKRCTLDIREAAQGVLQINAAPRPQHVFVKKILRMEQVRCKIILEIPENKNIYASSQTGNIKAQNITAKSARLYTAEGAVDIEGYQGNLSAETLTGRITARAINCPAADLKSASGNINAAGNMKHANVLNTSGASRLQGVMEVLRFYSSEGNLYAFWDEMPQNPLEISARSFAGNLEVLLPPKTDLSGNKNNIYLKTFYGAASISARAE